MPAKVIQYNMHAHKQQTICHELTTCCCHSIEVPALAARCALNCDLILLLPNQTSRHLIATECSSQHKQPAAYWVQCSSLASLCVEQCALVQQHAYTNKDRFWLPGFGQVMQLCILIELTAQGVMLCSNFRTCTTASFRLEYGAIACTSSTGSLQPAVHSTSHSCDCRSCMLADLSVCIHQHADNSIHKTT